MRTVLSVTRVALVAGLWCLLTTNICEANVTNHVIVNTSSSLIGHPAGPFALAFQLTDGSGAGDANNAVTLTNFQFGSGSASGTPTLIGSASGNLVSSIVLTDGAFLNAYIQSFTPGDRIEFDLSRTTNSDSNSSPDHFSFSILDRTGTPIPTQGGLYFDVLVAIDFDSSSQAIQAFGSDPTVTPQGGGNPLTIQPTFGPTAAPATISGTITTADRIPLAGVTMRIAGSASATTITDNSGNYRFDDLETENFYAVTPSLVNYHFSPANRSFSLLANKTDAVFTGSADALAVANAIDTNEYFVRQQYLDFLGREPEQGGLAFWSGKLNQCNGDAGCLSRQRVEVSAAFFGSLEFQVTGAYVYRLYQGALGRQLSYNEFVSDRQQVIGGANLEASKTAFASTFVNRAEFAQKYQANTTASSFVDALLQTLRDSSGVDLAAERSNLINHYNAGGTMNESRALVARDMADSMALSTAVYNPSFVLMEYFGYLRRPADPDGYAFWLSVLNNGDPGNYGGMVCSFITSNEYQRRFGGLVTHSNSECPH